MYYNRFDLLIELFVASVLKLAIGMAERHRGGGAEWPDPALQGISSRRQFEIDVTNLLPIELLNAIERAKARLPIDCSCANFNGRDFEISSLNFDRTFCWHGQEGRYHSGTIERQRANNISDIFQRELSV